jgi:CheY-like chemotaxis protein
MKAAVLIVDDSEDTRELLAELFMHEGYHSIMARDGQEALRRLSQLRPDIIITDFMMPEMTGVALIAQVRANLPDVDVPIVMITGSEVPQVEAALAKAEVKIARILTKPVHLGELLRLVSDLTEKAVEDGAPPSPTNK